MLQLPNVFHIVRGPKLNILFEVQPQQCQVQGDNSFPHSGGHSICDTSPDASLGCLASQQAINQYPQVPFHRTKETNNPICSPGDQKVAIVVEGCAVNSNGLRLQGELQLEGKICINTEKWSWGYWRAKLQGKDGRTEFRNKNSGLEPYTSNDYKLQCLAAAFYCDTKQAIHLSQATAFLAMASRLQNQLLAGISLSMLLSPTCQGQHFT